MFYSMDQPHTLSFPIRLVKTESNFIVRLAETGLGKLKLAVAVISVDAYPFLAFSDMNCHLEDKERYFLDALCLLIVNRLNLKVAIKSLLYQQVKIPGSFSAMLHIPCVSLQLFPVLWIFLRSPGITCYDR